MTSKLTAVQMKRLITSGGLNDKDWLAMKLRLTELWLREAETLLSDLYLTGGLSVGKKQAIDNYFELKDKE